MTDIWYYKSNVIWSVNNVINVTMPTRSMDKNIDDLKAYFEEKLTKQESNLKKFVIILKKS